MNLKSNMELEDLKLLIDSFDGPMVLVDRKGIILAMNKSLEKIFNISRDKLIGTSSLENLEKIVYNSRLNKLNQIIETKKIIEWTDFERDRWWTTKAIPILDESGNVIKIVGIIKDVTNEKHAKKQLIEVKERWNSLVENIPNEHTILIIDKEKKIVFINRVDSNLTMKDVIGQNALEFIGKEHQSRINKLLDKLFNASESVKFELNSRYPNGKTAIFSGVGVPIEENDKVKGALIIANDITKLRIAEQERNRLNERYKLLLEKSGCPITFIDLDGNIVLINEVGARNLDGIPDDFIGKSIYEVLPDFADEQKNRINKIIRTGDGLINEDEIELSSGKHWFLSYLQPIKINNKIQWIQIFSIDITKQKNIEHQIKETKEYLRNIIENTNEIIFTINRNKKIYIWNESAQRITGLKQNNVIKKSIFDLNFILNHEEFETFIDRILSKKKADIDTIMIQSYDNSPRYLSPSFSIIKDNENNITDIVFICHDITSEIDVHNYLEKGTSYIYVDDDIKYLFKLLSMLRLQKKKELIITREPYDHHYIDSGKSTIDVKTFSSIKNKRNQSIQNPDDLRTVVIEFLKTKNNPVVFIDRIDYLINNFGVHTVIPVLYEINDMVRTHNAILFLKLKKHLLTDTEYMFFQEEYQKLPTFQTKDVYLTDDEFKILNFLYDENNSNRIVKQIDIVKHCSISKVTAHKKIIDLIDKSLVFSKHVGRTKQFYITEQGRQLIRKK